MTGGQTCALPISKNATEIIIPPAKPKIIERILGVRSFLKKKTNPAPRMVDTKIKDIAIIDIRIGSCIIVIPLFSVYHELTKCTPMISLLFSQ